jgi:hypothetical protein
MPRRAAKSRTPTKPPANAYAGRGFALLTQHGKDLVLAPLLADALGASLHVVTGFDTDTLGTFTRDVPREGTQLEAARRKARLAIERSSHAIGLGSEGSFAPDAWGLMPWNIELVVCIDSALGIEVVGHAQGPGLHVHGTATIAAELEDIARRAGFPEHGLVVRPGHEHDPRVRKGLRTWPELHAAFEQSIQAAPNGAAFIENDLRAHMHPTRMAVIERAGRDLVERLACACAACGAPGFGLAEIVPGLPCAWCGLPTQQPLAQQFACVKCAHRERRPYPGPEAADPGSCARCNP